MNRTEFIMRLAQLLEGLPLEERGDALKFYNNYFDDAGPEHEADVIRELGSPEAVAAAILGEEPIDGVNSNTPVIYGTETKHTQQNDRMNEPMPVQTQHKKWSGGMIALIVILCVMASPILLGLAGAAFGIIIAVISCIFGVCVAVTSVAAGCTIGGLAGIVYGIFYAVSYPAGGMMTCALSMVTLAVGLLFLLLMVLMWGKAVPACCRGIGRLCRKLFRRRNNS